MVQHRTRLTVADNSGAKIIQVIQPLGGTGKRKAIVGQIVVGVVKGADPNGAVKNHEIVKTVIVRCKKEIRRDDGSYIKFDDNAGVIVDNEGNLKATRIFGPIAREVRDAGYTKIVSLAQEVW
ncbi:50S ribosomal protein L14 [Candidatus Daviesbacteria bacterium]|nr:50S ribosomal protein L14 [Candidatus Daviesbacteria bacterium]